MSVTLEGDPGCSALGHLYRVDGERGLEIAPARKGIPKYMKTLWAISPMVISTIAPAYPK